MSGKHVGASARMTAAIKAYDSRGRGGAGWDVDTVSSRRPTPAETAAARQSGKVIQSVVAGGVRKTRRSSSFGPGRLRTNEAVRLVAGARSGVSVSGLKPFRKVSVARMPDTPVSVGIVMDLSPSMTDLCLVGHSLRWMLAEAVHGVGGQVAAAGFIGGAWPMQAPGERDPLVREWPISTGTHSFRDALLLVDGGLGLLDGDGARVLFVFGDYEWESPELAAAQSLVLECERHGVGVVSVLPNGLSTRAARAVPGAFNGHSEVIETVAGLGLGSVKHQREVAVAEAVRLLPLVVRSVRRVAEAVAG